MAELQKAIEMTDETRQFLQDIKDKKMPCIEGFYCEHCHNTGQRNVENPKYPCYSFVVKCNKCKYWDMRKTDF
jgi:hypothetical protein